MLDFIDTKPFEAAFTGLGMLATSYVAGASGWSLVGPPLLVGLAYYAIFLDADWDGRSRLTRFWSAAPPVASCPVSKWAAEPGIPSYAKLSSILVLLDCSCIEGSQSAPTCTWKAAPPLRGVAAKLEAERYMTPSGERYSASAVHSMLGNDLARYKVQRPDDAA